MITSYETIKKILKNENKWFPLVDFPYTTFHEPINPIIIMLKLFFKIVKSL